MPKRVYIHLNYTKDLDHYLTTNLNKAKQEKNQIRVIKIYALRPLFEHFMFKLGPAIAFGLAFSAFRVPQGYAATLTPSTSQAYVAYPSTETCGEFHTSSVTTEFSTSEVRIDSMNILRRPTGRSGSITPPREIVPLVVHTPIAQQSQQQRQQQRPPEYLITRDPVKNLTFSQRLKIGFSSPPLQRSNFCCCAANRGNKGSVKQSSYHLNDLCTNIPIRNSTDSKVIEFKSNKPNCTLKDLLLHPIAERPECEYLKNFIQNTDLITFRFSPGKNQVHFCLNTFKDSKYKNVEYWNKAKTEPTFQKTHDRRFLEEQSVLIKDIGSDRVKDWILVDPNHTRVSPVAFSQNERASEYKNVPYKGLLGECEQIVLKAVQQFLKPEDINAINNPKKR